MIDIDEMRESEIRLHGLTKVDDVCTFYYDETNNIRKLHIKPDARLNVVELKVFVLGGLMHEGSERPLDIQSLRTAMRIQVSASEIKLAHVAKGSFLDVLGSRRLTAFLNWVANSGLKIHYQTLDPLFWSVADIIDSIAPWLGNPALVPYYPLLKSDLTTVLRSDIDVAVRLFHQYSYPGLSPNERKPFLDDLVELVDLHAASVPSGNADVLRAVLKAGKRLDSLEFIEGYPANLLIDDFSTFYRSRLALFKFSNHILDTEEQVRARLLQQPLVSNNKEVTNFRFTDSKAEPGIQLSDVAVGLLGKMYSYFTETNAETVADDRDALDEVRLQNALLLRDIISASHSSNIALINHVASVHDVAKLDLFLRFEDGAYAG